MTRKSFLTLSALMIAVVAMGAGMTSASAAAKGSLPVPQGWRTFSLPAGVNPAKMSERRIQGSIRPGGCLFSESGKTAPGSAGREQDEIALNLKTCSAIYAEGPIQRGAQPASTAGGYDGTAAEGGESSGPRPLDMEEGEEGEEEASGTQVFYMKSYYEDPIGINVTSLRQDLEWKFKNGCITSDRWKRSVSWYTTSGWGLDYVEDAPHIACLYAVTNSTAEMTNEPFCFPETVWTTYNYNHEVEGQPNGVARWEWNDEVNSSAGICSNLLSHSHEEGFEEPWPPIE